MSEWRGIESAPKNGSGLLMHGPFNNDDGFIERPHIVGTYVAWWEDNKWRRSADDDWFSPTHWQPLPEPPK